MHQVLKKKAKRRPSKDKRLTTFPSGEFTNRKSEANKKSRGQKARVTEIKRGKIRETSPTLGNSSRGEGREENASDIRKPP